AEPRDHEERPGRQAEVEGEHIVAACSHHLVEKRVGLHRDDEQQYQRRENVDHPLISRADIPPHQIDRNMRATVGGGCDAPENQNAEHQPPEVIGIRDRIGEQVTKQNLQENVSGDDTDKKRRHPFDGVDETIHIDAFHDGIPPLAFQIRAAAADAAALWSLAPNETQYAALSFSSCALSSFMMVSGSPPAFLTLSAQVFSNGSAAFFHS